MIATSTAKKIQNFKQKSGKRILVVVDDYNAGNLIEQTLERGNHKVTTTGSGEQALQLFKQNSFPIVFADINMQGMSGLELLRSIRDLSGTTQIILITNQVYLESAIEATKEGAMDYIVKPFENLDDFTKLARQAINKNNSIIKSRIALAKINQHNELIVKNGKEISKNNEKFFKFSHSLNQKNSELSAENIQIPTLNNSAEETTFIDKLTGLPNRRSLYHSLENEIIRAERCKKKFSILYISVCSFWKQTKNNGIAWGDEALKEIAGQLVFRKTDVVARYHGENFVALFPETSIDGAAYFANQLIEKNKNAQQASKTPITLNIGLAAYGIDGEDIKSLITSTKESLKIAKQLGKNKMYHSHVRKCKPDTKTSDNDDSQPLLKTMKLFTKPKILVARLLRSNL